MINITEKELYGAFYSVIKNGSGDEIARFFREQLFEAKGDKEKTEHLLKALQLYNEDIMNYEMRDIFKTLKNIVNEKYLEFKGITKK